MAEGNRELVTNDDVAESYSNEAEINENTLANIANENIREQLLERMDPNFGLLDKLLANKALDRSEFQTVKSRDATYERNARLFDIITKKRKYRELFEALRDSNQKHLVNYVTANGVYSKRYSKVWPLTSRKMDILDYNQESLVNTIDVSNNELIGKLYAIGFLNKRQRDHLCELQHSYKKTEAVLEMLQRSSLYGYSQMIACLLEMNQSHVAQLLHEGGDEETLELQARKGVEKNLDPGMSQPVKITLKKDEIEEEDVMPNPARNKWLSPVYTIFLNGLGSLLLSLTSVSPLLLRFLGLGSIASSFQLLIFTLSSVFVLFSRLSRNISLLSDDVVSLFVYIASIPLILLCFGSDSVASHLFAPFCTLSLILLLCNCFFKISSILSHISRWKMRLAVSGTLLVAFLVTGLLGKWVPSGILSLLKLYPTATRLALTSAGSVCECLCALLGIKRSYLLGLVQWLVFVLAAELIRVYGLFVSYNLYRLTLVLWAWNYLLSQRGFLQSAKTHKINASRRSFI